MEEQNLIMDVENPVVEVPCGEEVIIEPDPIPTSEPEPISGPDPDPAPTIIVDPLPESEPPSGPEIYNPEPEPGTGSESDKDPEYGSCDCRSECKYNTGDRTKYANYGYSD